MVVDTHDRLLDVQKRFAGLGGNFDNHELIFAEYCKVVEEDFRAHADAITELFEKQKVLEGIALQYRPASFALIVRRHMDEVRYSIAAGFMLVFKDQFKNPGIINWQDESETTVHWSNFLEALNRHFCCCNRIVDVTPLYDFEGAEEMGKEYELCRQHSPFHHLADDSQFDHLGIELLPNLKLVKDLEGQLEEDNCFQCHKNGQLLNEGKGAFLERMLNFYLPTLIWGFNVAKKQLMSADATLRKSQANYDNMIKLADTVRRGQPISSTTADPIPVECPVASRFDAGTALDVRRKEPRRGFIFSNRIPLDSVTGPREPRPKGKRRAEEEARGPEGLPQRRFRTSTISSPGETSSISHRRNWHRTKENAPWSHIDESDFLPDLRTYPLSSSQHSTPAPAEPQVSITSSQQSVLQSVTGSLDTLQETLSRDKQSYSDRTKEFNNLRRCIHIILDPGLMRVAVLGGSFVRRVVNQLAHKKHEYTDTVRETLASSAMLIKESGLSGDEDEQDINYDEALKEIEEQLYSSNDYFETGKTTTEKKIDSFVEDMATPVAGKVNSDYHILLQWLDSLKPIPAEST
ncbi:uncharacterized protein FOMMEDRAFT_16969 [Fomitiporia mediterranea MF3/22]|uniref:uncharacterized protein n=1 Tax=Fomitiporia mediterranea (strain MF3/22) TaxID=694068 RepID=UPI0004407E49|nr:uncharacterized protein FOMMEDRAFT_16969 [Fomitiporia mediterranea MF3/22]EJD06378.1 hypothetical protein FOMMEDRAFT_16969 [Fomitiporia mediterranea MF3/22]